MFETVYGAIYLEADLPAARFDEGHLQLLMSIAAITATAFRHERQIESMAEENSRLAAEAEVQRLRRELEYLRRFGPAVNGVS